MGRTLWGWVVVIAGIARAVTTASAQEASLPAARSSAPTQQSSGAALPGGVPATPPLDALIQQFQAGAPPTTDGVELDAWVERTADGRQVVVEIEPQGALKLVADPGITITPTVRPGVTWLLPLPHRHVDPQVDYFAPPALVRLPFAMSDHRPLELLVEYAYCVVDFQCFFGEETLTVALP
jgi:hypothetical protein